MLDICPGTHRTDRLHSMWNRQKTITHIQQLHVQQCWIQQHLNDIENVRLGKTRTDNSIPTVAWTLHHSGDRKSNLCHANQKLTETMICRIGDTCTVDLTTFNSNCQLLKICKKNKLMLCTFLNTVLKGIIHLWHPHKNYFFTPPPSVYMHASNLAGPNCSCAQHN